ncbi:hypothetical protein KI387_014507, partial [Taxus chinensis]
MATFKEEPCNSSSENKAEEKAEKEKSDTVHDPQGTMVVSGTKRGHSPAKSDSEQESLSENQMALTNLGDLSLAITTGNGKWQEVKNKKNKKGRTAALELPNLAGELAAVPLSRIAFGSCANQSAPQPIWDAILRFNPQLFIWLGDNIYADNKLPLKVFGKERTIGPWKNTERFFPVSEKEMNLKYNQAKTNPGYAQLRRKMQVIGTWDDHDYGLNDAGKEYPDKAISQKLMLDFLDEALDSPRRKQEGVYASYVFGPVGKKVK